MSKLFKRFKRLVLKFDEAVDTQGHYKQPFHLDYESGVYREDELVKLIRGALPKFALTPDEYKRLFENDDLDEMYRLSFSRISKAKKNRKGDYGELLLFLILKAFYGADRLVTKVRLRTSVKEQIKGFDCAHFDIDEHGKARIWLGEVKFYKSFSNAASDIIDEIEQHLSHEYLKNEFSILCPNIEYNEEIEIPEEMVEYLDGTISLDDVRIIVPALITYESSLIKKFESVCDNFKVAFKKQFEEKFNTLNKKKLNIPSNVELMFILLPLNDIERIKTKLESFEEVYK